jgi:hypothetical protein
VYELIHAERANIPVTRACRILGASRSGYYISRCIGVLVVLGPVRAQAVAGELDEVKPSLASLTVLNCCSVASCESIASA